MKIVLFEKLFDLIKMDTINAIKIIDFIINPPIGKINLFSSPTYETFCKKTAFIKSAKAPA